MIKNGRSEFEFNGYMERNGLIEMTIADPLTTNNNDFYNTLSNLVTRFDEDKLFAFFNKRNNLIKINKDISSHIYYGEIIVICITYIPLGFEIMYIFNTKGILFGFAVKKEDMAICETDWVTERYEVNSEIKKCIRLYDCIYNTPKDKSYNRELIFEIIKENPGICITHPNLKMLDITYIFSDSERLYDDGASDVTIKINACNRGNWLKGWTFVKADSILDLITKDEPSTCLL